MIEARKPTPAEQITAIHVRFELLQMALERRLAEIENRMLRQFRNRIAEIQEDERAKVSKAAAKPKPNGKAAHQ